MTLPFGWYRYLFQSGNDAEYRPGNVHSATGTLDLIKPIVIRYRKKFKLFWLRGDSAFAKIEWHLGELFSRYYFIVTNSKLTASKMAKVYNGRGQVDDSSV